MDNNLFLPAENNTVSGMSHQSKTIMLFFVFVFVFSISGSLCAQNSLNTTFISQWGYGPCEAVAESGLLTFFGNGCVLMVMDRANPAAPVIIGSVSLPDLITAIAVQGNYAYIGTMDAGLRIVNISNPAAPYETGFYNSGGSVTGVVADANYAYITFDIFGLRIINITNPSSPQLTGSYYTINYALGVEVKNGIAYLSCQTSGLFLVSVSNPANPVLLGSFNTSGDVVNCCVVGNLAYVADWQAGLKIINIANPAAPVQIGSYATPVACHDVVVRGDFAYLSADVWGLYILNISNPVTPQFLGNYSINSGLQTVLSGNYAYMATYFNGMQIVNITNPSNPTLTFQYDTPGSTEYLTYRDGKLYVTEGFDGLRIFDVTAPQTPLLLGNYNTQTVEGEVDVKGNYAYLPVNGGGGLKVLNISNPANPVVMSYLNTPWPQFWNPRSVTVDSIYAYVIAAGIQYYLSIVNVSNPANSQPLGFMAFSDPIVDVKLKDSLAFVCANYAGLRILNVADKNNPFEIGSFPATPALDIAISGNYAFLVTHSNGLVVLNISNPANPVQVGYLNTSGYACGVAVSGNYCYIADYREGLRIIDVCDPSNPHEVGYYNIPGFATDLSVNGNLIYMNAGYAGFFIIRNDLLNVPASITNVTYTEPDCQSGNNGTITISATGGDCVLEYSIDNGVSWYANGGNFTGLSGGIYNIKVKDGFCCTYTYSANPIIINQLSVVCINNVDVVNVSCYNGNNGMIYVAATGGIGDLQYSIDNGTTWQANNGYFNNLTAGIYNIKVKDSAGHVTAWSGNQVVIPQPAELLISSVSATPASCAGIADGIITVQASGGTGMLRYSVDNGLTWLFNGGLFTGLSAGAYQVAVLDDFTCQVFYPQNPVYIDEPEPVVVTDVVKTDVTAYGLSDGSITIEATGGIPPLQYSINNGVSWQADNFFPGLFAGSYPVAIKDFHNCILPYAQNPVIILEPTVGINDLTTQFKVTLHPNPFPGITTLTFFLESEEHVKIEVYNAFGQKISVLTDQEFHAGKHSLIFDGNQLKTGLYYFKAWSGSNSQTGKIIKE